MRGEEEAESTGKEGTDGEGEGGTEGEWERRPEDVLGIETHTHTRQWVEGCPGLNTTNRACARAPIPPHSLIHSREPFAPAHNQ